METKLDRTVRETVDRAAHVTNVKVKQQRGRAGSGEENGLAGCEARVGLMIARGGNLCLGRLVCGEPGEDAI